jgi:NodT family efflux transporter outer membrane factor (OMF) lipoprotein
MLLSGCNVYRTYKPANEVPENLYRNEVSAEDTASIANMDWKELFTDPILQDLIEEALENNTDMKTAQLKVESAKASLMSARLAFLPSINLAPQGTLSSFDGSPVSKAYNIAASASWEIDIFGKLRNASKSAAAALMQSKEYEQAVRTGLIAGMANCYYTLLLLDEQLSISENTLVLWAENVKTMKAMKEAGMTNEAGVAQIEASYLATEASVVTLKTQIEEMENTISNMLAKVPGPVKRGKLENQSFPEQLSVGVPVDLLRNRPDVRMAEYGVAQAFYGVNIARGQFYPSLTLSGTAGWTNSGSGIISNPGAWLLQAVGQVVQPIFNRGALIANLKISKNAYEEAALAFQQTVLEAGSEVNNALTQWQASRQRLDLTAKQVAALETAYKSTQLLMQHSSTTYLEVLTAQQTLLQAQLGHSAEKYNEIQAVISLYNALGGGRN